MHQHTQPPTTLQATEEEILNGLTHGLGLVLSLAGLWAMMSLTSAHGTWWQLIGCGVYGGSLVVLYGASTLYHALQHPQWKETLRIVDHVCIYLMIAGTYTPFMLTTLRGPVGFTLLALVWAMALGGTIFKLRFGPRYEYVSLGLYMAMGWLAVLAAKPIIDSVPAAALGLLLGGGLVYSVGTIFYLCDTRRFFHAIWHVFVLGGSALHFCAVMYYVVP